MIRVAMVLVLQTCGLCCADAFVVEFSRSKLDSTHTNTWKHILIDYPLGRLSFGDGNLLVMLYNWSQIFGDKTQDMKMPKKEDKIETGFILDVLVDVRRVMQNVSDWALWFYPGGEKSDWL